MLAEAPRQIKKKTAAEPGFAEARIRPAYSHSIVPGGFEVTS